MEQPPPIQEYAPVQVPTREERTWAMLCHVLALSGLVIPFANVIAPLIVWLLKREDSPFVDDQGKEAINFQITVTIVAAACVLLAFVVIGFILLPVVVIAWLVLTILATIRANEGVAYRFPFTIRLIK